MIRESVKYIRSSPSRKEKFQEIIEQHGVPCRKTLGLDVPTRLNSTYMMIDIAKECRGLFDSLAVQDRRTFQPSFEDWENAEDVCTLLKVFYEATNVTSDTKYPTSNLYFHEMWKVKLTLEHQHYEEDSQMGTTVKYMKRKFKRYWKMSWLSLCIPVILYPQFKLKYIAFRFGLEFGNELQQ
uniref:hAT-like transposase RNase-H fold domain-containing protein n=1 Tax=Hordeum vulgare subsp. vulgare TaxID=112509 RepID=A0A8I6WS58_HORVV